MTEKIVNKDPFWLEIAREIQALSQSGLAFAQNEFEIDRYKKIESLSAKILAHCCDEPVENSLSIFSGQEGYATPKIDVRSAVIKDNKILLVKEKMDGRWAMPGGWADVGDFPSEVAIRETLEESGYNIKINKLIACFDANRSGRPLQFFHAFKIIFLCDCLEQASEHDHEILEVGFFEFDKLPPLSENRTNMKHINEVIAHLNDSNRPAAFD